MRAHFLRLALTGLVASVAAGMASAADVGAPGADRFEGFRFFDEMRLGVHAHNPTLDEGNSVDVSGEILTSPINGAKTGNALYDILFNPRLHVGVMGNTRGWTSYGYAGVTWRADFTEKLFGEVEFGGAVNNAIKDIRPNRITLGCPVTFHESVGLGYRMTQNVSVIFDVAHVSHANLCGDANPGLTNFGVKLGYRF